MHSTKILKNFCSSILWSCLHHIVILISQNRITVFYDFSLSQSLWPTKINLLRQRYCSKCGAGIEWCRASFIFCSNPAVRPILYKSGTGYSLHQAPETPDNKIHWPNADIMLGHCLRRLANNIPMKALYGLITIFNHEHIFYLNTS